MNLDIAHQLSLIQRNLEMAQVSIDSATELLNIVINGASIAIQPVANAPAPAILAPNGAGNNGTWAGRKAKPKPKSKNKSAAMVPVVPKNRGDGKQDNASLIADFAAHHSGQFTSKDALKWIKEHGYVVDQQKFMGAIYNSAHAGRVITQVGKGVYKRTAA